MTSLRTRVALLFCALGGLCITIAGIGAWGMTGANYRARSTYEQVTLPTQNLESAYRLQLLTALMVMEGIVTDDPEARRANANYADNLRQASDQQLGLFQKAEKSADTEELAGRFIHDRELAMREMGNVIGLLRTGDTKSAWTAMHNQVRPAGMEEASDIEKLIPLFRERAERAHQDGIEDFNLTRAAMATIVILGGAILGYCVWRQLRAMNSGLGYIEATLGEVSQSLDLSRRATQIRKDEIGRTATAFNQLMDRIENAIDTVRDSAHVVRSAVGEIVAGNVDLSARTEEQASSLEQTTASMMELTDTVLQNSHHARRASDVASKAADMANEGQSAVNEMVTAMQEISDSSGKISEIINVMEGIAFQTNILALNASVEAARAGEHGRGFAVVAHEVRNLAQRSATSAREIGELITASLNIVEDGTKKARYAGITMEEILKAAQGVSSIIGGISTATDEQSQGIEQVKQAIAQIDTVTQQNADLAGRTTAIAQSLEIQASRLSEAVSQFRLTNDHVVNNLTLVS
ncbi:methyl-accepting chemotaxis protein [Paraburkholderia mimosarum]|uniref:methyl-accepting chemotaxis protein n=1 Tax=Paraburkholderia mimosarum TaxID=312026 RepID=UPI0039C3DDCE